MTKQHLHIAQIWVADLLRAFDALGIQLDQNGIRSRHPSPLGPITAPLMEDIRSLWHQAARKYPSPTLGIEVARRITLRAPGVLLPIMLHSPTILAAMQNLATYQVLISDSGQFEIVADQTGRFYLCKYIPTPAVIPVCNQQVLSVVTVSVDMLQRVAHQQPGVISLQVPSGMDSDRISAMLGCACSNHEGHFSLRIGAATMDAKINDRDARLYETNLGYAETLLRAKRQRQSFVNAVKKVIDIDQPAKVSITTVARRMNQTPRTLQRKLRDQNANFRSLKTSVLKTRALDLLVAQQCSPKATADNLGYSDLPTFYRAFRQWYKTTPGQFCSDLFTSGSAAPHKRAGKLPL